MEHHARRIQQDNRFRFWVSGLVLVIGVLLTLQNRLSDLLWILVTFIAYTAVYGTAHLAVRRGRGNKALHYALIAADVAAITAAVAFTGGIDSPLYVLYPVLLGFCIYHESMADFVYGAVLSGLLYGGMLVSLGPLTERHLFAIAGQLILLAVLTAVLYTVLIALLRDRKARARLVARARTLADIANVLSGSVSSAKEAVKLASRMIDDEVEADGLKCRIVIQRGNQPFLPPSGRRAAVQVPIVVGDNLLGTLVINATRRTPLTTSEHDFFSSIARSLGLALHRAKLWEDFQSELKRVEAKILLSGPEDDEGGDSWVAVGTEFQRLSDISDLVQIERGKWRADRQVCELNGLIDEAIDWAARTDWGGAARFLKTGSPENVAPFLADRGKLRKLISYMLENAAAGTAPGAEIEVEADFRDRTFILSVHHPAPTEEAPASMAVPDERVRTMICRKIAEAHGGLYWSDVKETPNRRVDAFELPFIPVAPAEPARQSFG